MESRAVWHVRVACWYCAICWPCLRRIHSGVRTSVRRKRFFNSQAPNVELLVVLGRSHGNAKVAMSSNRGCPCCIAFLGGIGEACLCRSRLPICHGYIVYVNLDILAALCRCWIFLNHFPPVVGRRDSVSHGSSSDEWLVLGSVVCSISCPYGLRKKSGRHRRRSVIVCCQKMSNLFSSSLVHRWSRRILRRAGRLQSLASP